MDMRMNGQMGGWMDGHMDLEGGNCRSYSCDFSRR
jgi:hypothetical protein